MLLPPLLLLRVQAEIVMDLPTQSGGFSQRPGAFTTAQQYLTQALQICVRSHLVKQSPAINEVWQRIVLWNCVSDEARP